MTKQMVDQIIDTNDEQLFWSQHNPNTFATSFEADSFEALKPSTKIITLRVPEHLLSNLKLIANKRDIPYQSLLKFFLQEKVNEELQTPFLKLKRKAVRKTLHIVALSLVTLGLTYSYLVQPIKAQGNSMDPQMSSDTYHLLDKLAYKLSTPQRGDVVVFNSPSQPNAWFVKRVVALPGETIAIENGFVFVNGEKLYEAYAEGKTAAKEFHQESLALTVPGNSYYVLGDNRSESTDSRDFGFVTRENIIGKVSGCYWNCK